MADVVSRPRADELILVRHAPVAKPGHLFGATDVAAALPGDAELANMRSFASDAAIRVSSPALRCRQTAGALWPDQDWSVTTADLWEQSFGDWDGLPYDRIPNIGPLSGDDLAAHAAPNGESFRDLCARAQPLLLDLAARKPGPVMAVVHVGIIRACIALAIGSEANALRFEVDHLSLSRFVLLEDGSLVVRGINHRI